MQAKAKSENGITIVYLSGRVDVETAEPFRTACLRELRGQKVVFDFSGLGFVGSQGLLPFLETLQTFYGVNSGEFKFSRLGVDFQKLLSATPLATVPAYETIEGAMAAFYLPKAVETRLGVEAVPMNADQYLSLRPEIPAEKEASDYNDDVSLESSLDD